MREGVGRLHRIHGTLNAAKYIEILGDAFFGTLADYKPTPFDITFQHDRDPKHIARLTQRWLQAKQVNVLPWPSRSPDLNIIEHVWAHLKLRVHTHEPAPRNKEELWAVTQEEWNSISPDFIARRVLSVYTGGQNSWDTPDLLI